MTTTATRNPEILCRSLSSLDFYAFCQLCFILGIKSMAPRLTTNWWNVSHSKFGTWWSQISYLFREIACINREQMKRGSSLQILSCLAWNLLFTLFNPRSYYKNEFIWHDPKTTSFKNNLQRMTMSHYSQEPSIITMFLITNENAWALMPPPALCQCFCR